jgi:hypothetical protein
MSATDLSKLPPGAKVFFVHVQFRVAGNGNIYQLLLNHLNGGIHGGLYSMRVRHDDQVFDLPLGQYIVAGNWGIDKVFDRVEKAHWRRPGRGPMAPRNRLTKSLYSPLIRKRASEFTPAAKPP